MTDAGLKHLEGLTDLRRLWIEIPKVTDARDKRTSESVAEPFDPPTLWKVLILWCKAEGLTALQDIPPNVRKSTPPINERRPP